MPQELSLATEVTLEDLIEMVGDDTETIKEIVETFLDDSPNILEAIAQGITEHDSELAERNAHTIKSSSRLFRAEQFAAKCQIIENAAKAEDWETTTRIFTELQADYVVIAQAITSQLKQI